MRLLSLFGAFEFEIFHVQSGILIAAVNKNGTWLLSAFANGAQNLDIEHLAAGGEDYQFGERAFVGSECPIIRLLGGSEAMGQKLVVKRLRLV